MNNNRFLFVILFLLSCLNLKAQINDVQYEKAIALHEQAIRHHEDNRDSVAFKLAVRSILTLDSLGQTNTPIYAEFLHDAGMLALLGLNDSIQFSKYMQEAINIKHKLYGDSGEYYWSKECYANGFFFMGNNETFPKNVELWERAIDIYEEIPSHDSIDGYMQSLNNLSVYYEYIDVRKSIELCEKILNIKRETMNPDSLITLSNLSRFYMDLDIEKSLFYAQTVLETRLKTRPKDYDKIRISHMRIASVLSRMGKYEKAINHSLEASNLAKMLHGNDSYEYALSIQNTGAYYLGKGDLLKALEYTKQAYLNPKGNKQETSANLAGIYSTLNEVDSCFKYTKESWLLFRKQYLFDLNNLPIENRFNYASVDFNYGQLILPINYYLQYEEHEGFNKLAFDCILFSKNIVLDSMKKEDVLLKTLTINFDSVKSYLGDNELAIEFWSNDENLLSWDGDIIVSILRKNYDIPKYVKLSKETIYRTLRNEIETTESYLPLYENIWKEIIDKAQIKEGERLFVSLDNILSQIPIESICNYEWEYVGDKYEVVRVSSTSNIPHIKDYINGDNAVLYGGLVYDNKPSLEVNDALLSAKHLFKGDNMYLEIGDSVVSELRSNTKYLPWTKMETDSIGDILSRSSVNKVVVLHGTDGTEESFRLLSENAPSIIHISTHGFCFSPETVKNWYEYYRYCMDHSGLLMSGVLTTDKKNNGPMIVEDGFLRSTEIAALDLAKTELLVLSACKTGLGGITPFGMVGLQRAFKAAGVNSILLTLNDVDDAATYFLMTSFYKHLNSGYPKRQALRKAQKALRDSELFHSFNYWGYFVLID